MDEQKREKEIVWRPRERDKERKKGKKKTTHMEHAKNLMKLRD